MNQNIDYCVTDSGLRYAVRISPRAKRCSIKIWSSSSVEVVIPKGFDQDLIPKMLEQQMSREASGAGTDTPNDGAAQRTFPAPTVAQHGLAQEAHAVCGHFCSKHALHGAPSGR